MRNIFSFDCRESVRRVVKKILKDDFGIKVPKEKSSKGDEHAQKDKVFGAALEHVPSVNVGDDCYCPIPRFLVEAVSFLEPHLKTEGLFRKSGSLARQKTIRQQIESGGSCHSDLAHSHDIASLMKQFLRELPDSVLSTLLYSTFLKCLQLNTPNEQVTSILMLCLLLPDTNLRLLQYLCQFVSKVAIHSKESKMTLSNLAIILSPNLMFTNKDKDNDKYIKDQTEVIDILFKNANSIGLVSDEIIDKVNAMEGEVQSMSTSSADELDVAALTRQRRHRRRSRSISGFVNGIGRKIKGANTAAGCTTGNENDGTITRHSRRRRTKSDKAVEVENLLEKRGRGETDIHSIEYCVNSPYPKPGMRSLKRRVGVHRLQGQTPNRKSPKLSRRAESCQTISSPILISMPNQFMLANKASFIPIMRSQEDVRDSGDVEIGEDGPLDEQLSPTLISSRFSLNLEQFNEESFNKENVKHPGKYSVLREKHLQNFIRQSSINSECSPATHSSVRGQRFDNGSMASPCALPRLRNRNANKWQFEEGQSSLAD